MESITTNTNIDFSKLDSQNIFNFRLHHYKITRKNFLRKIEEKFWDKLKKSFNFKNNLCGIHFFLWLFPDDPQFIIS